MGPIKIKKMLYTGNFKDHQMITWYINNNCNFQCDYCPEWLSKKEEPPIKVSKLAGGLSNLGKDWVFLITGGEPFLEPNFQEICQEITKNHFLAINTNLSLNNIFEFGDQLDPKRIVFINAAVHITEREKTDKDLSAYIQKTLYLQDKGFNIIAYYIAHPGILHRMQSDIDHLKSGGIEKVRLKMFRGVYQGKYFPASLTEDQRKFIRTFDADWPELALLDEIPSLKGKLCHTGSRFFFMQRNGDLRRCSGIFTKHGNLFEKTVRFDVSPKPCPASNCAALYEGVRNSISETGKVSFLDGLMLRKRYHQLKNVVLTPSKMLTLKEKLTIRKALP